MHELCDVAAVPSQATAYRDGLKDYYATFANDIVPEHRKKLSKGMSLDWEAATALMESAQQTKVRLERGQRKNI